MKKHCALIGRVLLIVMMMAMMASAQAQQSVPVTTPASTQPANVSTPAAPISMPLAPLATQLGQTIQTLVTGAAPNADEDSGQIADSFATHILDSIAHTVDNMKAHTSIVQDTEAAWPDFTIWLDNQFSDPHRQALWRAIGNDALVVVGVPILVWVSLSLFLWPLRVNLRRHQPRTTPGRVGLIISLFALRVVPVVVFVGLALLLLDQNEPHRLPRFVILNTIYALGLAYSIQQIARGVCAPVASHLRLFKFGSAHARGVYRWVSVFTYLIVYGYFFIDVASVLHVPNSDIIFFQNFLAFVLTVLSIIAICRARTDVAAIIRGKHTEKDSESFTLALRLWLSRHWHRLAVGYLVISLGVTLLGIDNGFALLLRGTILSIVIMVGARLSFMAIDYWADSPHETAQLHRQFLAFLLRPFMWVVAALAIAATWGFPISALTATPSGQKIVTTISTIAVTLFVLTVLYEMLSSSINRHLSRADHESNVPVASARARTLLPMVRTSVFILFCGIAALIALSSIGINIGPLLAGAGVLGVAVGFGSQTLVKDFLTGLFIVVENTIAIGDIIKLGDDEGVVEALSVRTLRLRSNNGSLHIIPFSDVIRITNHTRGFGYALVDVSVSYDSDLEHVMQVMRDVGAQIQADPVYKRVIVEPIEVMGIEALGDSSVTIRARMRTRPGKQWDIKRLLLLRIKQRFDREKIEIPYPTVTHVTKK